MKTTRINYVLYAMLLLLSIANLLRATYWGAKSEFIALFSLLMLLFVFAAPLAHAVKTGRNVALIAVLLIMALPLVALQFR